MGNGFWHYEKQVGSVEEGMSEVVERGGNGRERQMEWCGKALARWRHGDRYDAGRCDRGRVCFG